MNQHSFEQAHGEEWERLASWLDDPRSLKDQAGADFPALYRRVCHHLALARSRRYSTQLTLRLDDLVQRGHSLLYRRPTHTLGRALRFVTSVFPAAVRREWRVVLPAAAVFFLPLIGMLVTLQHQPDMVYTVLAPSQVDDLEAMYEPGRRKLGRERDSQTDVMMFGFYIWNNVGIAFRTFASGLLLGVGALFILTYNGLYIGAAAGHLTQLGYNTTFWSFVAGHSAFELTGIVLAGAAGLKLGLALLSPGRRSRLRALREASDAAVPIVIGAALLILLAAFIEAFWSSTTSVPPPIKYAVGIALWVLLLAYLGLGGRRHAA